MKIALFDEHRLGVVRGDSVVDVTGALPAHDAGLAANFWVRLCADLPRLRPELERLAATGEGRPLSSVTLRAPVLNPSKIMAAACNYADHVTEMRPRIEDGSDSWLLNFDVFLKAPSSIADPGACVAIPRIEDREVHHEVELGVVIGREGRDIPESEALDHVLGYTALIDITLRGNGDRSRRKSYDGFTPVGPWLVTADEIDDPHDLDLRLWVNGEERQSANTNQLLVTLPAMISYASRVMTLKPGDLFATGTPAGVGTIEPGDTVVARVGGVGELTVTVAARGGRADDRRPRVEEGALR